MQDERSLSELAKDVTGQAGDLLRGELRLARAETVQNLKQISGGLVRIVFGIVLAGAAVTLGLFALAYGLASMMPTWVAAIVAAVVGAAIAFVVAKSGLKALSQSELSLPKTREQVRRDIDVIKPKSETVE
jgi:uncharacterized membrane protein YeaQ/YmgE (transglycosylase-associated protein family)